MRTRLAALTLLVIAGLGVADEALVAHDEKTLHDAGIATDGPSLLQFFRSRTLSSQDQERLTNLVQRQGDSSFITRELATRQLIRLGRTALPFLRARLTDHDLEIAKRCERCIEEIESGVDVSCSLAAARLVAGRKPEGAVPVLLDYLPFADDENLLEELLTTLITLGIRDGKEDPALVAALEDKLALKRSAAALVLGRSPIPDRRQQVRQLLRDTDPTVRLRAANGLLAGRDPEALPVLVALLGDAPKPLAAQAEELLYCVAGESAPAISSVVSAENDTERKKCHEAWTAWHKDNAAKMDLAAFDMDQRELGFTLVCVFDSPRGAGRLVEFGRDGKPRWEITNLSGPIDAQILPNKRVLVAEHNHCRVRELDFDGKELWSYTVAHNRNNVVACQRLPNGNTFVATYSHYLELTPDKKELYQRPCPHGMFHARKLKCGLIACASSNGVVYLYDSTGKEVRQLPTGGMSGWITVDEAPGNRVVVPSNGKIIEFDVASGKEVGSYPISGSFAASKLRNGNILVTNHNNRTISEHDRSGKRISSITVEGRPFWAKRR
jgi:hypothetical protein